MSSTALENVAIPATRATEVVPDSWAPPTPEPMDNWTVPAADGTGFPPRSCTATLKGGNATPPVVVGVGTVHTNRYGGPTNTSNVADPA